MAMRRRIKVAVNLASARKPKTEPPDGASLIVKVEPTEANPESQNTNKKASETFFRPQVNLKAENEPASDKDAFKFPPKVEFNRSNSYTASQNTDDVQHIEIDDGVQVMQMDLQQSANSFQSSPLKSQRQRIKATPVFGQRRNSFLGTPTSPMASDDTEQASHIPRRERHYSGSAQTSTSNNLTGRTRTESTSSQKRERHYSGSQNAAGSSSNFVAMKTSGRVRTESTCSVFSDSHLSTTSKSRKTDEHNAQRSSMRREFEARFSNGVPDKSALKMADLIYYNPVTNPMEQKPKMTEIKAEVQEPEPEPDSTEKNNSAVPVPQLKLNAKGELILDDKSLEIETTAEQEARKVLAKSSLIFLDENTGMNGFYKRHKRTRDWPPEETIRFYRCLQTIGTDFSMMCQLFPKRTRRDLKLKFKKEERCNGALINKALLHPNSFDIQDLRDQFEIEDKEREEEEKERKAAKEKEKLAKKEYKKIHVKSSKAARALKNAQDAYKICEGHLADEPAKKGKRIPKKKMTKETGINGVEKTNEETNISKKKRVRKPRQTKPKISINKETDQEKLQAEFVNVPMKMEPEEIIEDIYVISNVENDMTAPDSIQQQFNILVQGEEYNGEQQENNLEERDSNSQHYASTDDENPRTFVNLDDGNLTQISKKEAPYLDNLYGAEYSNTSDSYLTDEEYEDATMLNYDKAISEICDTKPPIGIGKPTNAFQSESPKIITEAFERKSSISNDDQTEKTNSMSTSRGLQNTDKVDRKPIIQQEEPSRNKSNSVLTNPASNQTQSIQVDNEMAIQQILEDIASGTLQVVSSYDPDTPNEMITEIFMVDPKSGDLCDEPLDLPNELVQSILSVMM